MTLEVGIVGLPKSGKTTLCLVASGLAPRTVGGRIRGTIRLDGEEVDSWPMLRRPARICALPAAAGRLLRARAAVLNPMALAEGYRHREGWRYDVVRARRAR